MITETRQYETLVITKPDLDERLASEIVNKFEEIVKNHKGSIINKTDMGKRKLAFPIKKHSKGNFILYYYSGDPSLIREIERQLNIREEILRFQTIRIMDESSVSQFDLKAISQEEEQ